MARAFATSSDTSAMVTIAVDVDVVHDQFGLCRIRGLFPPCFIGGYKGLLHQCCLQPSFATISGI